MDLKYKILIGLGFFAFTAYVFHVTPEQIAACVDKTGWTEKRCQIELTR